MISIGVLDLQGDVREHLSQVKRAGAQPIRVRNIRDLEEADGLIIPGGESTTLSILMRSTGLDNEIKRRGLDMFPLFGTCAGMILLAKKLSNDSRNTLGLIDITVKRNAYGRQVDSFEAELDIKKIGSFPGVFIRAPHIEKTGPQVVILAEHGGIPVMVRQDNILCSSFHPELTDNLKVHQYFLSMVRSTKVKI